MVDGVSPGRAPSDAPPLSGRRVAALACAAALVHGLFDALTLHLPYLAPPYLRLEDGPEAFQTLSPLTVSIAASCVSGLIAVIALVAFETVRRRRALVLGGVAAGFWIFSAGLLRAVWLTTPWGIALLGIAAGIPRGLAVGWVLARGERTEATARSEAA
jgi:hypothetical protein